MDRSTIIKKYQMFVAGVLLAALGISLITKAELGTSPVTCPAYVMTFIAPYSLGTFVMIVNTLLFILQCIVLGKNFKKIQLLQLPAALVFSACIDGWGRLLSFIQPGNYIQRLIILAVGCVVMGFGVALEVIPNVLILPGEGLVRAIANRMNWEFGVVKTTFDISLVILAACISMVFVGKIVGIREGTVVAAFAVGSISRVFMTRIKSFSWCTRIILTKEQEVSEGY